MALVTPQDIMDWLNPDGSDRKFNLTSVVSGALARVCADAGAEVLGRVPENQSKMDEQIFGLVLTREATAGDAAFDLPLAAQQAIDGSCFVWVNLYGTYGDRKYEDAVACAVTDGGATLTLTTPLEAGDVAIADIRHNGANAPGLLKSLALDIAIYRVALRIPSLLQREQLMQVYEDYRIRVIPQLRDLKNGDITVQEWADLAQVGGEDVTASEGSGIIYPDGW